MRVRLMQIVDRFVGVPLCIILAALSWIRALWRTRQPVSPRKILFIELSEMGSAILAHSALVRAAALAGGASPYFLIFKRNRESCEVLELIPREQILVINDRSFIEFAWSALRTLLKIRAMGFDTVIDLELFSRFTAIFTLLTGAPNRVGFHRHTWEGLYRGNFLTHRVNYNPHQHIALNFIALVRALEAPLAEVPLLKRDVRGDLMELPQLTFRESEIERIWELLATANVNVHRKSSFIVFNPDPGDAIPIRGWPEDRFAATARQLLDEEPDSFAVIVGLARSRPFAERFIESVGRSRTIDLTGRTASLRELLALLSLARLLVTNDSGPAHLASLTRTPTVVIFGPETPALYGPLHRESRALFAGFSCSPCLSALNHRHTWCKDNRCLQAIPVSEVVSASMDLLRRREPRGVPSLFVVNSSSN